MLDSKLTRRTFIGGTVGLFVGGPPILKGFSARKTNEESFLPVRKQLPNPYTENGKPIVVIVKGTEFAAMLAKGMEILGGFARYGTDKPVIVKPNFILNHRSEYPVTSDPDSVMTTVEYLQKEGFSNITVADSRNTENGKPGGMFKYGGINDKAAVGGFKTNALRDDEVVNVKNDHWKIMPHVGVFKKIYDTPLIISMPTVKQHLMTGYTCVLKNNMGAIDEWSCMYMHLSGDEHKEALKAMSREENFQRLCLTIAEAASAVNPELTVIDARKVLGGSHLDRPAGHPREANSLIISADSLAADILAAKIFKEAYEPLDISFSKDTFTLAADLGIGVYDPDEIVIKETSV